MKNPLSIMLLISMLSSLIACTKTETPIVELEFGRFNGEIGGITYSFPNSKSETFLKTISYVNGNYVFNLEIDDLRYSRHSHQILEISLNDIPKQQSFQSFEPYSSENNVTSDGISFYTKTVVGDDKNADVKRYTTMKDKTSISVYIDRVDYSNLLIPSLVGSIKGYLYNIENSKDSILVNGNFRTQASR